MNKENEVRKILIYGEDFWDFYNKQNAKVKERTNWTIKLIKVIDKIPEKYLKHINETSLYEMRVVSGSDIYRIFCFFDKGRLIVVLNGFQKKTQKTPKSEIDKALKLQKQYFNEQKN